MNDENKQFEDINPNAYYELDHEKHMFGPFLFLLILRKLKMCTDDYVGAGDKSKWWSLWLIATYEKMLDTYKPYP